MHPVFYLNKHRSSNLDKLVHQGLEAGRATSNFIAQGATSASVAFLTTRLNGTAKYASVAPNFLVTSDLKLYNTQQFKTSLVQVRLILTCTKSKVAGQGCIFYN